MSMVGKLSNATFRNLRHLGDLRHLGQILMAGAAV